MSDIVVYNYWYELGIANHFCSAITIATPDEIFLVRNFDYGHREYLANNSIRIRYWYKHELQFESLGHAGFVGTHTAMKLATSENP